MRLLLDTHVLLWWLSDDAHLGAGAREQVAAAEVAAVSVVSAWEIVLKQSLGKLSAPDDLAQQLERHQFTVLPIHLGHALRLRELPHHHRDPFDRMLIAQAGSEGLTIVTADSQFARYDVPVYSAT